MLFDAATASSAASDPAIVVRDVSKHYQFYKRPQDRLLQMLTRRPFGKQVQVLQGVDFTVNRGETVGIIGRNGAGKSTLLQIIAGTLQPSSGSVRTKGRIAPLIELGSGFNPELTGRENVIFNGMILGMTEEEVKAKYDRIVAFANIGVYIDRPVKTYSSGMHARLAFAVAVHIDPEILIVDEILSVGDAGFQRKCMNRFYEIRDAGCTILIVAHDEYLIRSICQKALYLKEGQMVAFGDPADVVGRYMEDVLPPPEDETPAQDVPAVQVLAVPAVIEAGDGLAAATTTENDPAAQPAHPETEGHPSHAAYEAGQLFRFTHVGLTDETGHPIEVVRHGASVRLAFAFEALSNRVPPKVTFVFNLYTVDGVYVCGSTTLMDKLGAQSCSKGGRVTIDFPRVPLLAGKYVWRVAINDHVGMLVLQEAKSVCPFRVVDDYASAGVVHLERKWNFDFA